MLQFSNDLEVGYEKENKDSRYKLAIFRSLIKNQIVYNSAAWANQNFDPSIHQGLEIEFDKSINEKFNLNTMGLKKDPRSLVLDRDRMHIVSM